MRTATAPIGWRRRTLRPCDSGDDDRPVLTRGVDDGGSHPDRDADDAAESEQDRLAEELDRMCPLVAPSARRRPISRSPFEHGDHHDVGDADAADEERHGAEPEEQRVEGALRLGPGDECVRWSADRRPARLGRVGVEASTAYIGLDVVGVGSHVDGQRVSVEVEVGSRRRRYPTSTAVSISGAGGAGSRMPTT